MAAALIPKPKLSQATIVVGALAAAWILWLAVNNKLIVYWQILIGQGAPAAATSGTTNAPGSTTAPSTVAPSTTAPNVNNPFSWNDLPWPFGSGTGAAGSGAPGAGAGGTPFVTQ